MHVNKTKSERNGSLEYYHVTCIGKQNIQANIKRSNGLQSAQVSPFTNKRQWSLKLALKNQPKEMKHHSPYGNFGLPFLAFRFLLKFSVWEEQNRLPFTYPPQFRDFLLWLEEII